MSSDNKTEKSGLAQIASELNISIATVSRALRDIDGIKPETRASVKEAAMRLGYNVPSSRKSSSSHYHCYAVLVHSHNHQRGTNAEFLEGLSRASAKEGSRLLFHQVGQEDCNTIFEKESRPLFLESGELDGLILLNYWPEDVAARLAERHPTVALIHTYRCSIDTIGSNDLHGMRLLVDHLRQSGHTRIGFLGLNPKVTWIINRYMAFMTANYEGGFTICPEDVLEARVGSYYTQSYDGWDQLAGAAIERYRSNGTTAWVTPSNAAAGELIKRLKEQGIRVPEQIAVTGYHGNEYDDSPAITTVTFPSDEMGMLAIRHLSSTISGQEHFVGNLLFRPTLRIGDSTSIVK